MSNRSSEPTAVPQFESWGRYPRHAAAVIPLHWQGDFPAVLERAPGSALPVGMGRSYGDVCLLEDGTLLQTTGMDRLLAFDPVSGLLTAEAGITLAQILDFAVPRGFFLPVSPGTKFVTLGGAIANDIHGKNHHLAGTFGNHVTQLELVRSNGTHKICSRTEEPDFFAATIGGMGLTGVITWATLRLKPIVSRKVDYVGTQFHGIDEFLALTAAAEHVEYTVSWVDVTSRGKNFARGIFMQGDHSPVPGPLTVSKKPKLTFPFELPEFALNRLSVNTFNTLFFHKQRKTRVTALQDYEPFFYPLDAALKWNRMYGKRGLLQFQYVIPWESAREGTEAVLREVAKSGLASFLAVLKAFGDVPSPGMMSFPRPGHDARARFPHSSPAGVLSSLTGSQRNDARVWRPSLPRQGRTHDARAVPGLLPAVGTVRPLQGPRPHIELLGASHAQWHRRQRRRRPMSEPFDHNTGEEKLRIRLEPEEVPEGGEFVMRAADPMPGDVVDAEPLLVARTERLPASADLPQHAAAPPASQPEAAPHHSGFFPEVTARLEPLPPAKPAAVAIEDAAPRTPQRILVLGASSGIAQACIRRWATRGDQLFLVGRNPDRLAAVTADASVRAAGTATGRAEQAIADLDDVSTHNDVLAHAINALGGLDLAFIAVGSLGDQGDGERNFDAAAASLYTNFVAPVSALTWLANYCTQRRSGTLAVLSSVAGDRGRKSNYIYGSAKAGLSAFLGGLRNRVDREGVRIVTIKPGPVRTAMTQTMKGSEKFADVEDVADTIVKALDGTVDVVYVPGKWRLIMAVIRTIPERVFKRLNL